MMKVVGEEGTSIDDYIIYLKSEFFDAVYLQQNAFDPVDASTSVARQRYIFDRIIWIILGDFNLSDKNDAREYFNNLRQLFLDWNGCEFDSEKFKDFENKIMQNLESRLNNSLKDIQESAQNRFKA